MFDEKVTKMKEMFKKQVNSNEILKGISNKVFTDEISNLKAERRELYEKRFDKQEAFFRQIEVLERQR